MAPSETPAPIQFSLPELDCLSDLLVEAFASAESQHPSTISNLDTDLVLYEKKCVEPRVDVQDPIAFWFIQVFMQQYFLSYSIYFIIGLGTSCQILILKLLEYIGRFYAVTLQPQIKYIK